MEDASFGTYCAGENQDNVNFPDFRKRVNVLGKERV